MYYLVGLGNPGEKYVGSRHNVGQAALSYIIESIRLPNPVASSKYGGLISEGVYEGQDVACLFPGTFMNNSGNAVQKFVPKNETERLIVLCDDVDVPFGDVKLSYGRGDGGHNGVKSVIGIMGTKDFVRIRIGIAKKSFWTGKARRPEGGAPMNRHVLGVFTKKEQDMLPEIYKKAEQAALLVLSEGVQKALSTYGV